MSAHGAGIIGFAMPDRPPALPMALLLHELPDGTRHYDLLLAAQPKVAEEDRVVPTWRCAEDPLVLPPGAACPAERIGPHRGLYLTLDHPRSLQGPRGVVHPVHRGWHRAVSEGVEIQVGERTVVVSLANDHLRRVR